MKMKWSVLFISVAYLVLLKSHVKCVSYDERGTNLDGLTSINEENNAFKSPMVIVKLGSYKRFGAAKTKFETTGTLADNNQTYENIHKKSNAKFTSKLSPTEDHVFASVLLVCGKSIRLVFELLFRVGYV